MPLNISVPRTSVAIKGTGNSSRDTRIFTQVASDPEIVEVYIEGNFVIDTFINMGSVSESIGGPGVGKSLIGIGSPLITANYDQAGIGCATAINQAMVQWQAPKATFLGTLDSASGGKNTYNPTISSSPLAASGGDWLLFVSDQAADGVRVGSTSVKTNVRQLGDRDKIISAFDEDFTTGTVGVWKLKHYKNVNVENISFNYNSTNQAHCLMFGSSDSFTSIHTGSANIWGGVLNSSINNVRALEGHNGSILGVSNCIDSTFSNIIHEGMNDPLCFYGVLMGGASKNLYFDKMKIHRTRHAFTTAQTSISPEDIHVNNCTVTGENLSVMDTHESGRRINFNNCDVNIQFNSPSGLNYNVKGFQIRSRGVNINNCTIKNGGIQILASDCIVKNSDIQNPSGHGIAVQTAGGFNVTGTKVLNNYIHDCSANGIQQDTTSHDALIMGNEFYHCQKTPTGNVSYCNITYGSRIINNYFQAGDSNGGAVKFLDQGGVKVSGQTVVFNTFDTNDTSIVLWDYADVQMPEFDLKKNWYSDERDFNTISSSTTITQLYNDVLVDATSGPVTITLPSAALSEGKEFTIKKIDASSNQVVIEANGAETIDKSLNISGNDRFNSYTIKSDGVEWWIK